MEALKKDVEQNPDAFQYKRAAKFDVSKSGISSALKQLKISHKKDLPPPKSRPRKKEKSFKKNIRLSD